METGEPTALVGEEIADVLDMLLFYEKKQVITAEGVSLFPSEVHVLIHALAGLSLTDIAQRLAISTSAVSQSVTRLTRKGVVSIEHDRQRKNAAVVRLTPLGERIEPHIRGLRDRLSGQLGAVLARYSPGDLRTIERFLSDLRVLVRDSLVGDPTTGDRPRKRS